MDEKKRRGEQARFDKNSREGFLEKGREEEEKEKEFPLKKWMRPKKRSFIERSLEKKPFRFSKKKKKKHRQGKCNFLNAKNFYLLDQFSRIIESIARLFYQ